MLVSSIDSPLCTLIVTCSSQPSDLHSVMTAALISNKPAFVKLFLEHGVRLEEYATQETILNLYNNTDPSCLFYSKLTKIIEDEKCRCEFLQTPKLRLYHVSQVLRELLGDFTKHLYPKPKCIERPRLSIAVPHIKINVSSFS